MGHEVDGDITPIAAGPDFEIRKEGGAIAANALADARARRGLAHDLAYT